MERATKRWSLFIGLLIVAAVVAGCGSSSSSSSSASSSSAATSTSSSTPAGTTSTSTASSAPAGPTSATGAYGTTAGLPASGLARAAAGVAQYEKQATKIPVTTPVGKPIPTGKTIAVMNCGIPYCAALTASATAAATSLGWKVTNVLAGLTPESIHSAWVSVANHPPDGVIASGYPTVLFAPQLAILKAKGVPVVECCVTTVPGNGIPLVDNPEPQGREMAWWVVNQTKGKANILFINDKDYPIIDQIFTPEFQTEVKLTCPACKISTIDVPTTSFGTTLPAQIVSYLRSHPDVNYVALGNDGMAIGLPQALASAGLKVPFMGDNCDIINQKYVAQGQEQACVDFPSHEMEYQLVDALARIFTHQSVAPDATPPNTLLVAKTGQQFWTPSAYPVNYANYQQQYLKLWGK